MLWQWRNLQSLSKKKNQKKTAVRLQNFGRAMLLYGQFSWRDFWHQPDVWWLIKTDTDVCVCARPCVRVNRLLKMLKKQKNSSLWESVWGEKKSTFNQNTVHNSKFNFLQD